ncbi:SAP30-binding protein [Senna tora]|uniref:SAP30-binding protein n=1 Tax=Senna tora TaxID=362788 RepID=A0A834SH66_9FABA|nr:SAP30-binding protein [Senna tora]
MASKKKQSEGIALLSMYNDEEDDEMEDAEEDQDGEQQEEHQEDDEQRVVSLDSSRSRRGTLTIVDYGHDEVAMSPEPEDGGITGGGQVKFGDDLSNNKW